MVCAKWSIRVTPAVGAGFEFNVPDVRKPAGVIQKVDHTAAKAAYGGNVQLCGTKRLAERSGAELDCPCDRGLGIADRNADVAYGGAVGDKCRMGVALRANKSETIEWLKFTLEGVGERTHGYAFEDTAF